MKLFFHNGRETCLIAKNQEGLNPGMVRVLWTNSGYGVVSADSIFPVMGKMSAFVVKREKGEIKNATTN